MTSSLIPYLNYKTYGFESRNSKPVLVLLHGFLGNHMDWESVIRHLNPHFRVIAFDLPGHGQSKVPLDVPLTFPMTVEAIHQCISAFTEHYAVLGYSFGGRVAFGLQEFAPECVTHLLIESSTPGIQKETERKRRVIFDNRLADKLTTLPFEQFLDEWFDYVVFHSQKRHPDFPALLERRQRESDPPQLANALRMLGTGNQPNYWQTLRNITCPVLFITGEYDTKFKHIGEKLKEHLSDYTFEVVPHVSHNVHFEVESEFIDLLQTWLSKVKLI